LRKRQRELEAKIQAQRAKPNYPSDPVQFFEQILRLTPYAYQGDFLRDPSPLKVIRWCRRAGKTTIMTGDAIRVAALNPGSRILCIMPKYQQVKEIFFQGEAGLHAHLARMEKEVYESLIYAQLQTIIRFRNRAEILAEVPEPFTIRGHGPLALYIDEMNFIRKDRDLWLSALLPMTLTRTVYITIASTPWNKDSIYYKMCFDKGFRIFSGNVWYSLPAEAKDPGPAKYFLTWESVMKPQGPLDPYQLQVMREQYAGEPWRWRREMESSFVDDETAFLPSSLIIKCQNEELDFADFEDTLNGEFYIGWDLGRERDHNAVAVIDLKEDVRCLVHCKQFPLGTPYVTVMAYIKSICDRWKWVRAVFYDHTGTKGMDEQIERAGFPGVKGVDFTKPTKHGMATALKQLMMTPRKADAHLLPEDARRQFELPFDHEVHAELNVEQWEQMPGSEVYSFSHPEGSKDDRFWAIALACFATTSREEPAKLVRAWR